MLSFDGSRDPEQFPGARPLGASERARAAAYFTDELTWRSGFALRAPRDR